jgi:glycerophosphoryl diester phosphodiesterase
MKRIIHIVGAIVLLLAGFIYLNNADWLTGAPEGGPTLLAHRGLAQTFDLDGVWTNRIDRIGMLIRSRH